LGWGSLGFLMESVLSASVTFIVFVVFVLFFGFGFGHYDLFRLVLSSKEATNLVLHGGRCGIKTKRPHFFSEYYWQQSTKSSRGVVVFARF
jgi:hypothetical protein